MMNSLPCQVCCVLLMSCVTVWLLDSIHSHSLAPSAEMDFPSDFLPVSAITDGSVLRLPRQEVSAIIKQELEPNESADFKSLHQNIIRKCLDRNDDWAKKVEEIVISSIRFRDYVGALGVDDQRGLGLMPGVLDEMTLEAILGRVGGHGKLKTFTWCLNKPIPIAVLAKLQAEFPNVTLRVLKRQITTDAVDVPNLDIPFWTAVANPQVQIHRNDFGVFVWSTHPARSLRLHLLVPYYPAYKEARPLWMSRKLEVAIETIKSLPQLDSIEVSDFQGEISLLLPAIVTQAETLRVLKMHTSPDGLVKPSWLTPEQIEAMAEKLVRLEELEMDFPFIVSGKNEDWTKKGKELLEMPFTAPRGDIAALGRFKSLKTLRLWIEVPLAESVFQEKFRNPHVSTDGYKSPLKEDAVRQAARNLYSLLRLEREKNELGPDFGVLELQFTRVDMFDRQGCYPKFLPVTLRPMEGEVSVEVGEWKDDYPGEDVSKFIHKVVGYIH